MALVILTEGKDRYQTEHKRSLRRDSSRHFGFLVKEKQ
jgi:hypothetical protein